jgi:hypothetical protein
MRVGLSLRSWVVAVVAVVACLALGAGVAGGAGGAGGGATVFLVRGERLVAVHRPAAGTTAAAAMHELLHGPTAAERALGVTTTIPPGTALRSVRVARGLATVDLSRRFEAGGGSLSMLLRVAEVTATLDALPAVDRVAFALDGRRVTAIGGEGVIVDPPRRLRDVEGQLQPIQVVSPAIGDHVRSPLLVRGTANVFEAVLHVEVRSAAGRVLATRRIQASSGTGTRGTFAATVRFRAPAGATRITLVAYALSPKDGARIDVVRTPLPLAR